MRTFEDKINEEKARSYKEGELKGELKGKAEGLAEGELNGKKQAALAMLKEGLDIAMVSRITGLSAEEIEKL